MLMVIGILSNNKLDPLPSERASPPPKELPLPYKRLKYYESVQLIDITSLDTKRYFSLRLKIHFDFYLFL